MTGVVVQGTMGRRKIRGEVFSFPPSFTRKFSSRETSGLEAALTLRLFLTQSATQSVNQIPPFTPETTSGNLTFVTIIKSYSSLGNIVQSEANVGIPH